MAENILLFLFCIPAIIGLAEILHTFKMLFLMPKKPALRVLVVRPDAESFETQLLHISERCKWQGAGYADKIVVLSSCVCDGDRCKCVNLASDLGFVTADDKVTLEDCLKREEDGVGNTKSG